MVLNASYVCLLHFHFIKNHSIWILKDRSPHFCSGSVTAGIRARSGLNTHYKHLKIATTFTERMLSPYKDYSSLLRWQANMCSYIVTMKLHR
jgi:hypothetical protein